MANRLRKGDIVKFAYATKWKWGVTPNSIGYSTGSFYHSYQKHRYFVGRTKEEAIEHYRKTNMEFFKEKYTADASYKDNIIKLTPNWRRILG